MENRIVDSNYRIPKKTTTLQSHSQGRVQVSIICGHACMILVDWPCNSIA